MIKLIKIICILVFVSNICAQQTKEQRFIIEQEIRKLSQEKNILQDVADIKKEFKQQLFKSQSLIPETAVLIVGIHEVWTIYQYPPAIFDWAISMGIKPENLFFYSGNGQYELPNGIINRGAGTKQSLIDFVKNCNYSRIIVILLAHGGGYQKRIYDSYGAYSSVMYQLSNGEVTNLDNDYNETNLELGILRINEIGSNYKVTSLNKKGSAVLFTAGITNQWVGFKVIKHVPSGPFFVNSQGLLISQILKYTYYLSYANENGLVNGLNNIIWEDEDNFIPDLSYLNTWPAKIEKTDSVYAGYPAIPNVIFDVDGNRIQDVPIAVIVGQDTLLGVCLNTGPSFAPEDLTLDSNLDSTKNGFITGFDLNKDGVISLQTIVSFQEIIRLVDGLISDLELQEIFSYLPPEVIKIFYGAVCHIGGFCDNPWGPNSIMFAKVPADMFATCRTWPLEIMTEFNNNFPNATLLDAFNHARNWEGKNNFANRNKHRMRLNDNNDKIINSGPWPNNSDGEFTATIPIKINTTSVAIPVIQPNSFNLFQNYPNPFNASTSISYEINKTSWVKLIIYNGMGQKITIPIDEKKQPGKYFFNWNATNMPAGIYYVILQQGGHTSAKKMVLVK